jgi:hypothetical protein
METNNKLGQEPAFTTSAGLSGNEDIYQAGISKRFYTSCMVMQGLLANSNYKDSDAHNKKESFIKLCYEIADELLRQENL